MLPVRFLSFILVVVIALIPLPTTANYFAGYSFDPCRLPSECVAPRQCIGYNPTNITSCNPLNICSCQPPAPISCTKSSDCPLHERCTKQSTQKNAPSICTSCFSVSLTSDIDEIVVDDSGTNCPSLPPTPTPPGLNDDPCSTTLHCLPPGQCISNSETKGRVPCKPGAQCFCSRLGDLSCQTSADCVRGERCMLSEIQSGFLLRVCVSCHYANEGRASMAYVDDNVSNCPPGLPPAPPPPTPSVPFHCIENEGFSLDHCCVDNDGASKCAFPAICFSTRTNSRCNPDEIGCQCLAQTPGKCNSSKDCRTGERCVRLPGISACVSCNHFDFQGGFEPVDDALDCPQSTPAPRPSVAAPSSSSKQTPEPLDEGESPTLTVTPDSNPEDGDAPMPSIQPESTMLTTPSSEASLSPLSSPSASASTSMLPLVSPSPSISAPPSPTPPPCIDVGLLGHLRASELVFSKAVRADVLCDAMGSCATAGHIVTYRGRAMLMRRYCDMVEVSCSQEERLVNSPRMRRAVRVRSSTEELEFTALAAKWGSVVEEMALRAIVRMGW